MLEKFFRPRSVAVVGASRKPGKVGHDVVENLLSFGFKGKIFPVNPKAEEILGLKCYPRLTEIPEEIDLVVIAVPAPIVLEVLKDCAAKNVEAVVILSAGFKEAGAEGARRERELVAFARKHGIRIIGPNCLGVLDTYHRLNATFAAVKPKRGRIGFFSQSGALCLAVLEWAKAEGVGLSRFVSLGNKCDVSEIECLLALAEDPHTEVIMGYVEGIDEGRTFLEVARKVSREKPIIIFKSGVTAAGARAASSHTGSLAGSEAAYQAAFKQAGVLRAKTLREFFNLALYLALQPVPEGPSVVIVTNSGGPGIIAADACEKSALELPTLGAETVQKLREILPPHASFYNPVDVLGDADAERYFQVLRVLVEDPQLHSFIVILSRTATVDPREVAQGLKEFVGKKPLVACFLGEESVRAARRDLLRGKIPPFKYPEEAVRALEQAWLYRFYLNKPLERPKRPPVDFERAKRVLDVARNEGRRVLYDYEVREILEAYGFRFPKSLLARTTEEAVLAARVIGYPVVLKVVSPNILHKTDVGGVKVNIRTEEELKEAFLEITNNIRRREPRATIIGVLVQEMITNGREVILGFNRDPQFGPLVMFGLGGIYVEVLKDVSFRLAPFGPREAREMIREIKSFPLLKGVRGIPEADLDALVDHIVRFAFLVTDFPELTEGEINPLMVCPKGEGVWAVDARLILGGE
ncbi:MAG: CoA-binding protein [Thermodesulfobacteria bacterium]|nr:CoA-binding protein [Thermodesulfobacteriota bacterium]